MKKKNTVTAQEVLDMINKYNDEIIMDTINFTSLTTQYTVYRMLGHYFQIEADQNPFSSDVYEHIAKICNKLADQMKHEIEKIEPGAKGQLK